MVIWFKNVISWIVEHGQEILLFMETSGLISLIVGIFSVHNNNKVTKNNTKSNELLAKNVSISDEVKNELHQVRDVTNNAILDLNRIDVHTAEYEKYSKEEIELLKVKINAILDVQSVVYSTMKDDATRENIANIIASAKYADLTERAKLQAQIEALKSKIASQINAVNDTLVEETDKIEETIPNKKKPSRY